jgi:hypothetical protein
MAKVKIQGHASGTGVLTVTAPNTSTDRTITLPDESVTLGAATPSIDDNGDATAITINSSEQVGIGQTNPSYTLDVYKSAVGNVARFNSSSGNRSLDITSADNGSYLGAVWKRDINSAGGTHIWSTNGTERLRIQQAGGISFNGDTAAANALDDYEEGTHNSVWTTGNSGSITMNRSQMTYTKIGRLVTVIGDVDVDSVSSPVGGCRVTLPFTITNHSSQRNQGSGCKPVCISTAHHQDNPPSFTLPASGSQMEGVYEQDNGGIADYNPANGNRLMFSFSYQTDA